MRNGSRSLGEFPLDVVRIDCPRCDRAGSYRRNGLLARFGISPCPICSLPWRRAPGGETFLTHAARSSRILTSKTAGDQ